MRIEIRSDSVVLDGYVNTVARDSRPIPAPGGKKFIERIEPRAFQRALERAENVDLLLNHNKDRHLGSIKEGNLELFEDNIGLRAICTVNDTEVIEKAKKKQLRGWSFGFYANKDNWTQCEDGLQRRSIEELELTEVSIIDDRMLPVYIATSIEQRGTDEVMCETRAEGFKAIIEDNSKKEDEKVIDYSKYEEVINSFKK